VGPTAGRYYIDVSSGVPPKQFIRGEWFVEIAVLTGLVWILCDWAGLNTWWSAGIAFVIGFTLRVTALYRGWEEPFANEPAGVYQHSDGRPLLGRKLRGKSVREMRDLGLATAGPGGSTDDRGSWSYCPGLRMDRWIGAHCAVTGSHWYRRAGRNLRANQGA
jgi:hypothetical protein